MRFFFISCLLFLTGLSGPVAQKRQLSGRVSDMATGDVLPFATIGIKGSTQGCVADEHGSFLLELSEGEHLLVVQHIGYKTLKEKIVIPCDSIIALRLCPVASVLEEIVITGTGTPKLLKETPIPTMLIKEEDIKTHNTASLKEVLETELPAVEFTNHGGSMNINMGGMGGNYILFLLDGERIAGETRNNIDYNRINPKAVARIEIIKGASSALYGSNAIGGVINIISKKAQKDWQAGINAHCGSIGEQRYGVAVGFRKNKINSLSNFHYRKFSGYVLKDSKFQEYVFEDTVLRSNQLHTTTINGNENICMEEKFQYKVNNALNIDLKMTFFRGAQRPLSSTPIKVEQHNKSLTGNIKTTYKINDRQNIALSYQYDFYDKYDFFIKKDLEEKTYSNTLHTFRGQYNLQPGENHLFVGGIECINDALLSDQFRNDSKKATTTVGYVQHDVKFSGHWNLLYGVRMDWHTDYGIHVSPKAALRYNMKYWAFLLSFGHGFRSPSLKELYSSWKNDFHPFVLVGNKDLVPEASHNISLAAEYCYDRWNFSASGFYNQISNRITLSWNASEDTASYVNVGVKTALAGLELRTGCNLYNGLSLKIAYAYTNDRILNKDEQISSTRPHSLTAKMGYRFNIKNYEGRVSLHCKFFSRLKMKELYVALGKYYTVSYPSYAIWNLSYNHEIWHGIHHQIGVDNLFNYKADISTFNSSFSPGITFYTSLDIDLEELFCRKK